MSLKTAYAALLLAPTIGLADGCPAAPDHTAQLETLFEQARQAPDEAAGRAIANQMWELWDNAPDEPSQEMLIEGMRARAGYDFLRAMNRFDALVAYCPFYAEGYNQRAYVNFLREDYAGALPDLDRTLELNPRHVGALTGRALALHALNRPTEALESLDAALALNPWLPERHMRPVLLNMITEL